METLMIQEIDLQALTICRSMGFLEQEPDPMILERTQQLLEEAMQIAVPAFHYEVKDSVVLADDTVYIEDKAFRTGKTITRLLAGTTRLVLFVATAGMAFQHWMDEIKKQGDGLDTFIADTIGSCLVGACTEQMEAEVIRKLAPLPHTNRFSPGYCGWNLSEQKGLFACMPTGICDVTLTESCLMYPIKSVSGLIGFGEQVKNKVHECDLCDKRAECLQRKLRKKNL